MAWDIVALGTQTDALGGNLTLDEPTGTAQGDLIIACIAYRDSATFTLPSGGEWTLVGTQQSSGDTDATSGIASGLMAYCIRGASAPNYIFTRTAGDIARGRTITYRGQKVSPFDVGVSETRATIGEPTATAISTAEANELLVAMVAHGDNSTTVTMDAATAPSVASNGVDTTTEPTANTWIERQDAGSNTGADIGLFIADAVKSASGTTGTFSADASTTTRSVMIVGAFKIFVDSPPTVALNTPADAATGVSTTPDLVFTGTDPDGQELEYNAQIFTLGTEAIDQNYPSDPGATFGSGEFANMRYRGQTFTCGSTGFLTKIGFSRDKGSLGVKVYIDTVTAGNLPEHALGSELCSFTITNANLVNQYGEYVVPNPPYLTSGTKYCFYLAPWNTTTDLYSDEYRDCHGASSVINSVTHIRMDGGVWQTENLTIKYAEYITPTTVFLNKLSVTPDATFAGTGDPHPWPSGNQITYTVQSADALTANTLYYWRVSAIDPSGSNTYGVWSNTRSFTTGAAALNTSNFFNFFPFAR